LNRASPGIKHRAQQDATFLAQHPNISVLVEGHCDDRGSEEYNLALGTSFGKEKPFCTQDDEQCWQQNRVGHFAFAR